jgi:hypothetical protein
MMSRNAVNLPKASPGTAILKSDKEGPDGVIIPRKSFGKIARPSEASAKGYSTTQTESKLAGPNGTF